MSSSTYLICCARVNSRVKSWGFAGCLGQNEEEHKHQGKEEDGKVGFNYALLDVACCGNKRKVEGGDSLRACLF